MRHINSPFAIVSAHLCGELWEVNQVRHKEMMACIKQAGVPYKELLGAYAGEEEQSVLLLGESGIRLAHELGQLFDQDCILVCDNERQAKLVYDYGAELSLGKFQPATKEEAEREGAYTYDPLSKTHWITA